MTALLVLILRFALAIALYAFIGWALINLWHELKQQGELLAARKMPGIHLQARLENGREIRHNFYMMPEVSIGRDPNCDFPVTDDAISARHARITYHHNQWWLEDLNSMNGTFIGKSRVSVPTILISDEEFTCGNTTFTIQIKSTGEKLDVQ
jgi:predicted component of type VI protein secretion system